MSKNIGTRCLMLQLEGYFSFSFQQWWPPSLFFVPSSVRGGTKNKDGGHHC